MPNPSDPKTVLDNVLRICATAVTCRKCHSDVLSLTDKDGSTVLMEPNGVPHWLICTPAMRLTRALAILGSKGHCKSCNADVLWITSKNGKPTIWDTDGTTHWATCPSADQHRKQKRTPRNEQ